MDDRRPNLAITMAIACLVIVALLGIYVGGYFALSTVVKIDFSMEDGLDDVTCRGYQQEWLVHAYRPMAAVEAFVWGVPVQVFVVGKDLAFDGHDHD